METYFEEKFSFLLLKKYLLVSLTNRRLCLQILELYYDVCLAGIKCLMKNITLYYDTLLGVLMVLDFAKALPYVASWAYLWRCLQQSLKRSYAFYHH